MSRSRTIRIVVVVLAALLIFGGVPFAILQLQRSEVVSTVEENAKDLETAKELSAQTKDQVTKAVCSLVPGPSPKVGLALTSCIGYLQGDKGIPGVPGKNGIGTPGPPGFTGPRGPVGPEGSEGVPGSDGSTGSDGQPGANGDQGDLGAPGVNGQPGAAGEKGEPGGTGSQGQPGKDSTVPGPAGPPGPPGPPGASCPNTTVVTGAEGPQTVCTP